MAATLLRAEIEDHYAGDSLCRYEIVDGVEVEVPPMSAYTDEVALRTYNGILLYLAKNDIGQAQHEIMFRLALPQDRNRIPDVSFVSYERWPKNKPYPSRGKKARDVVPDLAIEVISPGDLMEESMAKIDEYFRSGVRMVWLVHCNLKMVYVYQSMKSVQILDADEILDGADVLPGFQLELKRLFPLTVDQE